jgi:hypothetical protein
MSYDLLVAHTEVQKYIDRIRSKPKREYAARYYRMVIRNGLDAPQAPAELSFMGAQAVHLKIADLMKGTHA